MRFRRGSKAVKTVAVFTAAAFLWTGTGWSAAEARLFWAERRAASRRAVSDGRSTAPAAAEPLRLARLAAPAAGVLPEVNAAPTAALPRSSSVDRFLAGAARPPAWVAALPLAEGTLVDLHLSARPDAPRVIVLQDVHQNASAQRGLARMLASLAETDPAAVVGLEGAEGGFRTALYRSLPDTDLRDRAAAQLLDEGLIGGPEFFALTAARDARLWGVEDGRLYAEHVRAFKDLLPGEAEAREDVSRLRRAAERLRPVLWTTELDGLVSRGDAYRRGEAAAADYLDALAGGRPLGAYPQLARLRRAATLERTLDFPRVEQERGRLIAALTERLDRAELSRLLSDSLAYRVGRLTYADYLGLLRGHCRRAGVALEDFREFRRYVDYVLEAERIDPRRLWEELERLEGDRAAALASSADARLLTRAWSDLRLAEKLLSQNLTSREWATHAARRSAASGDEAGRGPELLAALARRAGVSTEPVDSARYAAALDRYERFYRLADRRNEALAGRLLARLPAGAAAPASAVLVAGGFHTDGVADILRRRGLSYAVLSPRLDAAALKGDPAASLGFFRRGPGELARLLAGEKLFLNTPRPLAETPTPGYEHLPELTDRYFVSLTVALQFAGAEAARAEAAAREIMDWARDAFPGVREVDTWDGLERAGGAVRVPLRIDDARFDVILLEDGRPAPGSFLARFGEATLTHAAPLSGGGGRIEVHRAPEPGFAALRRAIRPVADLVRPAKTDDPALDERYRVERRFSDIVQKRRAQAEAEKDNLRAQTDVLHALLRAPDALPSSIEDAARRADAIVSQRYRVEAARMRHAEARRRVRHALRWRLFNSGSLSRTAALFRREAVPPTPVQRRALEWAARYLRVPADHILFVDPDHPMAEASDMEWDVARPGHTLGIHAVLNDGRASDRFLFINAAQVDFFTLVRTIVHEAWHLQGFPKVSLDLPSPLLRVLEEGITEWRTETTVQTMASDAASSEDRLAREFLDAIEAEHAALGEPAPAEGGTPSREDKLDALLDRSPYLDYITLVNGLVDVVGRETLTRLFEDGRTDEFRARLGVRRGSLDPLLPYMLLPPGAPLRLYAAFAVQQVLESETDTSASRGRAAVLAFLSDASRFVDWAEVAEDGSGVWTADPQFLLKLTRAIDEFLEESYSSGRLEAWAAGAAAGEVDAATAEDVRSAFVRTLARVMTRPPDEVFSEIPRDRAVGLVPEDGVMLAQDPNRRLTRDEALDRVRRGSLLALARGEAVVWIPAVTGRRAKGAGPSARRAEKALAAAEETLARLARDRAKGDLPEEDWRAQSRPLEDFRDWGRAFLARLRATPHATLRLELFLTEALPRLGAWSSEDLEEAPDAAAFFEGAAALADEAFGRRFAELSRRLASDEPVEQAAEVRRAVRDLNTEFLLPSGFYLDSHWDDEEENTALSAYRLAAAPRRVKMTKKSDPVAVYMVRALVGADQRSGLDLSDTGTAMAFFDAEQGVVLLFADEPETSAGALLAKRADETDEDVFGSEESWQNFLTALREWKKGDAEGRAFWEGLRANPEVLELLALARRRSVSPDDDKAEVARRLRLSTLLHEFRHLMDDVRRRFDGPRWKKDAARRYVAQETSAYLAETALGPMPFNSLVYPFTRALLPPMKMFARDRAIGLAVLGALLDRPLDDRHGALAGFREILGWDADALRSRARRGFERRFGKLEDAGYQLSTVEAFADGFDRPASSLVDALSRRGLIVSETAAWAAAATGAALAWAAAATALTLSAAAVAVLAVWWAVVSRLSRAAARRAAELGREEISDADRRRWESRLGRALEADVRLLSTDAMAAISGSDGVTAFVLPGRSDVVFLNQGWLLGRWSRLQRFILPLVLAHENVHRRGLRLPLLPAGAPAAAGLNRLLIRPLNRRILSGALFRSEPVAYAAMAVRALRRAGRSSVPPSDEGPGGPSGGGMDRRRFLRQSGLAVAGALLMKSSVLGLLYPAAALAEQPDPVRIAYDELMAAYQEDLNRKTAEQDAFRFRRTEYYFSRIRFLAENNDRFERLEHRLPDTRFWLMMVLQFATYYADPALEAENVPHYAGLLPWLARFDPGQFEEAPETRREVLARLVVRLLEARSSALDELPAETVRAWFADEVFLGSFFADVRVPDLRRLAAGPEEAGAFVAHVRGALGGEWTALLRRVYEPLADIEDGSRHLDNSMPELERVARETERLANRAGPFARGMYQRAVAALAMTQTLRDRASVPPALRAPLRDRLMNFTVFRLVDLTQSQVNTSNGLADHPRDTFLNGPAGFLIDLGRIGHELLHQLDSTDAVMKRMSLWGFRDEVPLVRPDYALEGALADLTDARSDVDVDNSLLASAIESAKSFRHFLAGAEDRDTLFGIALTRRNKDRFFELALRRFPSFTVQHVTESVRLSAPDFLRANIEPVLDGMNRSSDVKTPEEAQALYFRLLRGGFTSRVYPGSVRTWDDHLRFLRSGVELDVHHKSTYAIGAKVYGAILQWTRGDREAENGFINAITRLPEHGGLSVEEAFRRYNRLSAPGVPSLGIGRASLEPAGKETEWVPPRKLRRLVYDVSGEWLEALSPFTGFRRRVMQWKLAFSALFVYKDLSTFLSHWRRQLRGFLSLPLGLAPATLTLAGRKYRAMLWPWVLAVSFVLFGPEWDTARSFLLYFLLPVRAVFGLLGTGGVVAAFVFSNRVDLRLTTEPTSFLLSLIHNLVWPWAAYGALWLSGATPGAAALAFLLYYVAPLKLLHLAVVAPLIARREMADDRRRGRADYALVDGRHIVVNAGRTEVFLADPAWTTLGALERRRIIIEHELIHQMSFRRLLPLNLWQNLVLANAVTLWRVGRTPERMTDLFLKRWRMNRFPEGGDAVIPREAHAAIRAALAQDTLAGAAAALRAGLPEGGALRQDWQRFEAVVIEGKTFSPESVEHTFPVHFIAAYHAVHGADPRAVAAAVQRDLADPSRAFDRPPADAADRGRDFRRWIEAVESGPAEGLGEAAESMRRFAREERTTPPGYARAVETLRERLWQALEDGTEADFEAFSDALLRLDPAKWAEQAADYVKYSVEAEEELNEKELSVLARHLRGLASAAARVDWPRRTKEELSGNLLLAMELTGLRAAARRAALALDAKTFFKDRADLLVEVGGEMGAGELADILADLDAAVRETDLSAHPSWDDLVGELHRVLDGSRPPRAAQRLARRLLENAPERFREDGLDGPSIEGVVAWRPLLEKWAAGLTEAAAAPHKRLWKDLVAGLGLKDVPTGDLSALAGALESGGRAFVLPYAVARRLLEAASAALGGATPALVPPKQNPYRAEFRGAIRVLREVHGFTLSPRFVHLVRGPPGFKPTWTRDGHFLVPTASLESWIRDGLDPALALAQTFLHEDHERELLLAAERRGERLSRRSLRDAHDAALRRYSLDPRRTARVIDLSDVPGGPHFESPAAGGGFVNHEEARQVAQVVGELVSRGTSPDDIVVTAPFAAQLDLIRGALRSRGLPVPALTLLSKFPARDPRRVVVVSTVRSTAGPMEFLRRLTRRYVVRWLYHAAKTEHPEKPYLVFDRQNLRVWQSRRGHYYIRTNVFNRPGEDRMRTLRVDRFALLNNLEIVMGRAGYQKLTPEVMGKLLRRDDWKKLTPEELDRLNEPFVVKASELAGLDRALSAGPRPILVGSVPTLTEVPELAKTLAPLLEPSTPPPSRERLASVLRRVQDTVRRGGKPVIVMDMDDTMFDARPFAAFAVRRAAQEALARDPSGPRAAAMRRLLTAGPEDIVGRTTEALRGLGVDMEVDKALVDRFREIYYSPEWLSAETIMPGMAEFLARAHALGAHIVYLTGREESAAMRAGTELQLARHGLPHPGREERVSLILKTDDFRHDFDGSLFKNAMADVIDGFGEVVAAFDDLHANVETFRKRFPKADVLRVTAREAAGPLENPQWTVPEGDFRLSRDDGARRGGPLLAAELPALLGAAEAREALESFSALFPDSPLWRVTLSRGPPAPGEARPLDKGRPASGDGLDRFLTVDRHGVVYLHPKAVEEWRRRGLDPRALLFLALLRTDFLLRRRLGDGSTDEAGREAWRREATERGYSLDAVAALLSLPVLLDQLRENADLKPRLPARPEVTKLMRALGRHHPYSLRHSGRVGAFTAEVGKAVGFSRDQVAFLRVAGLLHDIGKTWVDVDHLNNTNPTAAPPVMRSLQSHAIKGLRSLRDLFPGNMAWVGTLHHQRLDADRTKAYPPVPVNGRARLLKGYDIPAAARLIALTDAFDAMTTDRPYQKTMSPEAALERLASDPGHFDPVYLPFLTASYRRLFHIGTADRAAPPTPAATEPPTVPETASTASPDSAAAPDPASPEPAVSSDGAEPAPAAPVASEETEPAPAPRTFPKPAVFGWDDEVFAWALARARADLRERPLSAAPHFSLPLAEPLSEGRRLVAVGDMHGDLASFLSELMAAGYVDRDGRWTGGRDTLVQLGDFMDRGPHSLMLFQYLMRLQDEARASGGEVVVLLGNHELMLLQDQWDFAMNNPDFDMFNQRPYRTFRTELRRAVQDGRIVAAHLAGGRVFVHAGVYPGYAAGRTPEAFVSDVNAVLRASGVTGDFTSDPLYGEPGLFWVEQDLQRLRGAPYDLVVGHKSTPDGRPNSLLDGKVVNIDVGWFRGGRGYIVLKGGTLEAFTRETPPAPPSEAAPAKATFHVGEAARYAAGALLSAAALFALARPLPGLWELAAVTSGVALAWTGLAVTLNRFAAVRAVRAGAITKARLAPALRATLASLGDPVEEGEFVPLGELRRRAERAVSRAWGETVKLRTTAEMARLAGDARVAAFAAPRRTGGPVVYLNVGWYADGDWKGLRRSLLPAVLAHEKVHAYGWSRTAARRAAAASAADPGRPTRFFSAAPFRTEAAAYLATAWATLARLWPRRAPSVRRPADLVSVARRIRYLDAGEVARRTDVFVRDAEALLGDRLRDRRGDAAGDTLRSLAGIHSLGRVVSGLGASSDHVQTDELRALLQLLYRDDFAPVPPVDQDVLKRYTAAPAAVDEAETLEEALKWAGLLSLLDEPGAERALSAGWRARPALDDGSARRAEDDYQRGWAEAEWAFEGRQVVTDLDGDRVMRAWRSQAPAATTVRAFDVTGLAEALEDGRPLQARHRRLLDLIGREMAARADETEAAPPVAFAADGMRPEKVTGLLARALPGVAGSAWRSRVVFLSGRELRGWRPGALLDPDRLVNALERRLGFAARAEIYTDDARRWAADWRSEARALLIEIVSEAEFRLFRSLGDVERDLRNTKLLSIQA
jgi:hypothetical protein